MKNLILGGYFLNLQLFYSRFEVKDTITHWTVCPQSFALILGWECVDSHSQLVEEQGFNQLRCLRNNHHPIIHVTGSCVNVTHYPM